MSSGKGGGSARQARQSTERSERKVRDSGAGGARKRSMSSQTAGAGAGAAAAAAAAAAEVALQEDALDEGERTQASASAYVSARQHTSASEALRHASEAFADVSEALAAVSRALERCTSRCHKHTPLSLPFLVLRCNRYKPHSLASAWAKQVLLPNLHTYSHTHTHSHTQLGECVGITGLAPIY